MPKTKLFSVTLDDCRVDTFTCGGKGGSGKDTNNSGVRIVHLASGAVGECREERHQHANKKRAFRRMAESKVFQAWARKHAADLTGATKAAEAAVEASMDSRNLKVEARVDGKWVPFAE